MLFLRNKGRMFLDNFFQFRIIDEVFPFMRIFAQVIELSRSIEVLNETVAGAADRIIALSKTGDRRMVPLSLWVFHEWHEALSFLGRVSGQSGQFKQGWEHIQKLSWTISLLSGFMSG